MTNLRQAGTVGAVIVGILSDTHDRFDSAMAGINLLRGGGAEFYLHCGDVGSERILDLFMGLPAALVWGNNDWDRRELTRYAHKLSIQAFTGLGEVELAAKQFALTHGDDPATIRRVLDAQQHDYLLLGHSHTRADQRFGRVRVINPGALYRAKEKSVALLDTVSDELKFLMLESAL